MAKLSRTPNRNRKLICSYEYTGPTGAQEKKDARFEEKDTLYTQIRHMHMKDTIDKLMADFNKFCQEHINFTDQFTHLSINC